MFRRPVRRDTAELVALRPLREDAQLTAAVPDTPPPRLTDSTDSTDSAFDRDRAITDHVRMFGIAVTQAGSFR
jgi:hypothetical protein